MPNNEHLDLIKRGIDDWNSWRQQNDWIDPDLSGADLSGADLVVDVQISWVGSTVATRHAIEQRASS